MSILFKEISKQYDIPIKGMGFDSEHVHIFMNIKLRSKPEVAKIFKGITGKKLFENFPEIKKKYFWNSGFWNPAYLMDNVGSDESHTLDYVKNQQKYSVNNL